MEVFNMSRPFKPLGLLKKAYNESKNPDKDKLINELIDRLNLPIQEPQGG